MDGAAAGKDGEICGQLLPVPNCPMTSCGRCKLCENNAQTNRKLPRRCRFSLPVPPVSSSAPALREPHVDAINAPPSAASGSSTRAGTMMPSSASMGHVARQRAAHPSMPYRPRCLTMRYVRARCRSARTLKPSHSERRRSPASQTSAESGRSNRNFLDATSQQAFHFNLQRKAANNWMPQRWNRIFKTS